MFWTNTFKAFRADLAAISGRFVKHQAEAYERHEKLFLWAVKAGERLDALEARKCRCGTLPFTTGYAGAPAYGDISNQSYGARFVKPDDAFTPRAKPAKKPAKKAAKKRK